MVMCFEGSHEDLVARLEAAIEVFSDPKVSMRKGASCLSIDWLVG